MAEGRPAVGCGHHDPGERAADLVVAIAPAPTPDEADAVAAVLAALGRQHGGESRPPPRRSRWIDVGRHESLRAAFYHRRRRMAGA
jgi:hypothetical protein